MSVQEKGPRVRVVTGPVKRSAPHQPAGRQKLKPKSRTPDDILRDVRGMKLRQRVSLVLNDQAVRDELEEMVQQAPAAGQLGGIRAYQDLLLPSGQGLFGSAFVPPIADIRGSNTLNYPRRERALRCKLAAVCRLMDLLGWTHSVHSQVSARVSADASELLMNPSGLFSSEVTASSLLKIDFNGNIKEQGSTNLYFNRAALVTHAAIYKSRGDVRCAIYTRQPAVVAVSCTKAGIMPISTEALLLGEVAYHELSGDEEAEAQATARDIEGPAKVLIMRNNGMICVGETVEEAFHYTHLAVKACEYQVKAAGFGLDNLSQCSDQHKLCVNEDNNKTVKGKQEFEAWMRVLDTMGYKTGYAYDNPDVFQDDLKANQEGPISSRAYKNLYHYPDYEGEALQRAHSTGRANTYRNRLKWLNTPVKSTGYRREQQQAQLDEDYEPAAITDLQSANDTQYMENKVSEEMVLESNTILNESAPINEEFSTTTNTTTLGNHTVKTEYKSEYRSEGQGEYKSATYVTHTTTHVQSELSTEVRALTIDGEVSEEQKRESTVSVSDDSEADGLAAAEPNGATRKKGSKVKKKASFKDTLVKTFGKK